MKSAKATGSETDRASMPTSAALNIREAVDLDVDDLRHRGGMPDSLLATNDANSFERRFDFIRTYLERDIDLMVDLLLVWPDRRLVVHGGDESYPLRDGVEAVSLGGICGKLAP